MTRFFLTAIVFFALNVSKVNAGNGTETTISGLVIDSKTKKPVMGITVTAIVSKAIVHDKDQTTQNGTFHIEGAPVSEVTLVFEKRGYKTFRKEGIKVKEGECLKLTFEINSLIDDELETDVYPDYTFPLFMKNSD